MWVFAIGAAAFMLVLTAFFAAVLARAGIRLLYWIPMALWWLLASGVWCTIAVQAWVSVHQQLTHPSYFPQALFLALIAVLMIPAFVHRAWMRNTGRPDAARWPRLQLAGSCLMLLVVSAVTVMEIDRSALSLARMARPQIESVYRRLLGPDPAETDNAAELYRQAFALCKQTVEAADSQTQQAPSTGPATAPAGDNQTAADHRLPSQLLGDSAYANSAQLAVLIGKLQPAIELARKAAIRSTCRMDKTASIPTISQPMPYLAGFSRLSSAVYSDALVAAQAGRTAEVVADLLTLRRMEQHVQQSDRCMMSLMAGLRIGSMANDAIAEILPSMASVPEHMEMIVRDDALARADMLAALQGEELRVNSMLLDVAENKLDPGQWLPQIGFAPAGAMYRILYLRSDLEGAGRYFAQSREVVEGHDSSGAWQYWKQAPLSMTAKLLDPAALWIVTVKYPSYLASSHSASLCIALMRYHRANGKYPAALDDLVPTYIASIPADPFDNKPMRYRLEGQKAIVYSIGENLKDDGGVIHSPPGTSASPEDVGLELKPVGGS